MIDEDWRGFNSAFAESVRPEDPRGLTGRRMLTVSISVVLAAALGALIYGALGGPVVALPDEVKPLAPSGDATPYQAGGQPSGQTWTGIAGPSCAASSDGSTDFGVYGYYTGLNPDQSTGWSTDATGGYTGEACTGGFISLPVSGKPAAYDPERFALWTYDFSSKFTDATCQVSTYVPTNSSRTYVGGDPAYFYYYGRGYSFDDPQASPTGGFTVNQLDKQGSWVDSPSFQVTTGKVSVKLVNAGVKTGAGQDAHVAAAQVRLTCTST
ncbi:hypothetical protein K7472_19210 [Streptomyces sp. PTM05]|uniref:Adhesin n=1 Tax=Streptantibioticus parmotrematis TaxID=2873249 RepID=A0ABS7QUV3_9ACTN|nr:hypothetical protein [Streptantibioticus parmotrematis]MBY8886970.1 hypothetical protein [Streptantibioticus parmotrematis]